VDGNAMITEDPALEFYDYMPTVWDDTRVIQGSIGQYAVIARRSGEDWFVGAMNEGTTRSLHVPLEFLPPGRRYIAHRFYHAPSLATRTHVRIERKEVSSSDALSLLLAASDGQALRLTPAESPGIQSVWRQADGTMSLVATGKVTQSWSWWAATNLGFPRTNWTLITTGVFANDPTFLLDTSSTNYSHRFYRLSSP
jgi:hypothetical protein